jgi:hypothetical protein
MKYRKSLVDEKVCGFLEWKEGLHKEDIQAFGYIVERPTKAYHLLYKMYKNFQSSPEILTAREYYYGSGK